ncbi:MAG: ArsR/SmtB family transcription factor [Acidimicrobiia bacterium]
MTTTDPRVRDFTESAPRRIRIEIDPSPAYELLFELFALDNPEDSSQYAAGQDWLDETRGRLPAEFLADLEELKTGGEIWLVLLGLVYDTPAPKTIEAFLDHLKSMDPDAFRAHLIARAWFTKESEVPEDIIAAAAAGDEEAYAAICRAADDCSCGPGWANLLALSAQEVKGTVIGLLEGYAEKGFDGEVSKLLDRDARAKRALAASLSPVEMIERATNGITLANTDGVEAVILIPSVVIRPFVVITDHGALRIFGYPVSEEFLTADEDAPPSWLVDFYKAVGDEKRLRILTVLAQNDATLGDLVERLDLSKSTVHHHLRLLRTAGLVRVTIGEEHVFSLRPGALPQAGPLLETYLNEHTTTETE